MVPSSFMISQMTPAGYKPGDAGDIDAGFSLSGTHEHAAVLGAQGKDVPGPGQVRRLGLGINGSQNGGGAIGSRDTGGDTFAAIDRNGKSRAQERGVVGNLRGQMKLVAALLGERQTDQPAG